MAEMDVLSPQFLAIGAFLLSALAVWTAWKTRQDLPSNGKLEDVVKTLRLEGDKRQEAWDEIYGKIKRAAQRAYKEEWWQEKKAEPAPELELSPAQKRREIARAFWAARKAAGNAKKEAG